MRRWRIASVVACTTLALGLFVGCGGMEEGDEVVSVNQAAKTICGDKTVMPLYAHDGTRVGRVVVRNNNKKVIVKYKLKKGWVLWRTKYHFARKAKKIPTTKLGSLNHFKFKKQEWHKSQPNKFVDKIKRRNKWDDGTKVNFAAFARVAKLNSKGWPVKIAGAWAGKAGWKGYIFNHTMKDCYLDVSLPSTEVTMVPKVSSKYSKWILNLSNVPDGYDVWDGPWNGWCVEKVVYMTPGKTYKAKLVSSQDTANLPDRVKNVNWQLVNYMINNRHAKATVTDVQNALWYVLGYITKMPTDAEAKSMVLDAYKNGMNFRPKYGDNIAVVFMSAKKVQLVFLEVQP